MVHNLHVLEMKIILSLLKGDSHVRGLSKDLGESHVTVSRRLVDLAKENVVDFRLMGRNKIFFLRKNMIAKIYIFRAEFYKLVFLFKRYPELEIIFEDVLKKVDGGLIILFGSYAKFNAKRKSDIDIYIENGDKSMKKAVEEINSKINVKIGVFDLKSPLIREIVKGHVVLRGVEEFYEKVSFSK